MIDAGVLKNNIQVKYFPLDKKFNVLVKLDVRDDDLPLANEFCSPQLYAGLLYSLGVDGNVNSHSLIISPYLESILGSEADKLRISSSKTIDPSAFHDLTALLEEALNKIREELKRRRHIVAALNALYLDNLVDYDGHTYSHATLQFTLDEARYVVRLQLKGEMELDLYAMNRFVKIGRDENVLYNESEPLSFSQNPSSPGFAKHLHNSLDSRLKKFIKRAMELPSS